MIRRRDDKKGMVIVLVVFLIFLLAMIGWGLHNYMRFERNLVAHLQFSSVADKMAQSAAQEAAAWFNCQVLCIKGLLQKDKGSLSKAEAFVLAPITSSDIENRSVNLTADELKMFALITSWGGTLNSVKLEYVGFKNYFNAVATNDLEKSCQIPADPFERVGGLVITVSVKYKYLTRTFCCRYEIKITNTLMPVLSKFTLFAREKGAGNENQLRMDGPVSLPGLGFVDFGAQGILADDAGCAPMILIHHPDDVAESRGYASSHAKIRKLLPMAGSVLPSASAASYRPSMADRGWVFLGATGSNYYLLNTSPGNANPDVMKPYPPNQKHRYYGNGFMMLESDLYALAAGSLKGYYPYPHSFSDLELPPGVRDFILRIVHSGIYWTAKTDFTKRYLLGNYYVSRPSYVDESSLLQLCGDLQPVAFKSAGMPSRYIDRRSPTVVFGKVFRAFIQVGTVMQNCVHKPGEIGSNFMNGNMHKMPFELCPVHPAHPQVAYLPYFEIDDATGLLGLNLFTPFIHPTWRAPNTRLIVDAPPSGVTSFAPAVYDVKNNVFKCLLLSDANHLATYKFFMSKVVTEPFNKSYDWIVANSVPADGIIEPGANYALRKDPSATSALRILDSCNGQGDNEFFYGSDGKGDCYKANNLQIFQFGNNGERCTDAYPEGLFKGFLGAVKLASASYQNPMSLPPSTSTSVAAEYDIRQKANFIFPTFGDFEKNFMDSPTDKPGTAHITSGGVYYIDSDQAVDLTKGGRCADLFFHHNTMLIFKKDVKLPNVFKGPYALKNGFTLTIVSVDGNVTIGGENIQASLNAINGKILKAVDYFQVSGNLSMNVLDFDTASPGNLFKVAHTLPSALKKLLSTIGSPTGALEGFQRISVTYDPALDPCNLVNYLSHYNYNVASRQTYWKVSSAGE